MSLIREIAKGALWTAGAQWVVQITQFLISIVLARILSPGDYGLLGLVLVYTGFVNLFSNLGMGPALIQKRDIDDTDICTAFWATFLVALTLFFISILAAPHISIYFDTPELTDIVRVTAVVLLLSPLNAILYSLLTRKMAFRSLAIVEVTAAILSSIAALIGALTGLGVWALVMAQIANPLIRLPFLLRLNNWIPKWHFDKQRFSLLFSFSSNVIGFNIINYFTRNLDKLFIGKILGPVPLGHYDMSYQIMLKPLQSVTNTLSAPLFPALSTLQNDKPQSSEAYRQVITYIAYITFPAMAGIALVAQDFVSIVLGPKWTPTVPVLQILCIVGAIQSVMTTTGDIYLSQGRSDIMLKWSIIVTPLMACAFYIGTSWGIVGVAACYAVLHLPMWVAAHGIANPLIGLSARRFWSSLLTPVAMTVIMSSVVLFTQFAFTILEIGNIFRLAFSILSGVISYTILLLTTSNSDVAAIRIKLLGRFRRTDTI